MSWLTLAEGSDNMSGLLQCRAWANTVMMMQEQQQNGDIRPRLKSEGWCSGAWIWKQGFIDHVQHV